MYTYVGNNCSPLHFFFTEDREYDQPLIGSMILDDRDFVKLCKNFDYYMTLSPVFQSTPRKEWHKGKDLQIPYPITMLDDIEVHWIHEKSEQLLFEKYERRRNRYLTKKPIPIFLLSYADLMNVWETNELLTLLSDYLTIPTAIYLSSIQIPEGIIPKESIQNKDLEERGQLMYIKEWSGITERDSYNMSILNNDNRLIFYKRAITKLKTFYHRN